MQRKAVLYDKGGDQHFDFISAWIKSTRGSDPDASLYYLAAMLEGGEDPRYIARRMIVLASEDIGNADPQALPLAVAAAHAVEHVGLPGVPVRARAGGDLPVAGAEVERREARDPRRPRAHRRARRRAGAGPAAHRPRSRRRASTGPRRRLREPARRARATSTTRSTCRPGLEDLRFYAPDDGEPALRERLAELRRARGRRAADERAATTAIGRSYVATRGEDPRIAAAIHAALGDARTVLNVGAGRRRRTSRATATVTAVEPSAVMRAQRPPGAAPCIDARAEALPFADARVRRRDGGALRPPLGGPARRAARAAPGRRGARSCSSGTRRSRTRSGSTRDYLPSFRRDRRQSRSPRRAAALGATRVDARADPARLPRRLPDGVLAPARRRTSTRACGPTSRSSRCCRRTRSTRWSPRCAPTWRAAPGRGATRRCSSSTSSTSATASSSRNERRRRAARRRRRRCGGAAARRRGRARSDPRAAAVAAPARRPGAGPARGAAGPARPRRRARRAARSTRRSRTTARWSPAG